MLFVKRWVSCFAIGFFFCLYFGSALSYTVTDVNATLARIDIGSVTNLYAYEINLDYTGTIDGVTSANFLGSTSIATYGSSTRNSILSVYGSRLDSTQTGVSGSGTIANITHTGTVAARYIVAIYTDGSSEYVYYNNSGSSNATSGGGSTGGGGGGSSGNASRPTINLNNVKITSDPDELIISAVAGTSFTREVIIKNAGTVDVTLTITPIGFEDVVVLDRLSLAAGEEKKIPISFEGIDRGVSAGQLAFSIDGSPVYELPIVINTRSENFLFDSILTVAPQSKLIRPGNTIKAQINLQEVVKQSEKVDVVASYIIKDFSGATYFEESETFYVLGSKDYEKEFAIPELPPGKYILGLEITYPGAFATTSAQFQVAPPFWSLNALTITIISVAVMAVIAIGVILWAGRSRRKLYGRHHK